MREAIELASLPNERAVDWLREAARFSTDAQQDDVAAERHLAVALRLAPRDANVAAEYREAAARAALRLRKQRS
jgi:hypothetical protein